MDHRLWHLIVHAGTHLAHHLGKHMSHKSTPPTCRRCGGTPDRNMGCCSAAVCDSCVAGMVTHIGGKLYRVNCSCCGNRRTVEVD